MDRKRSCARDPHCYCNGGETRMRFGWGIGLCGRAAPFLILLFSRAKNVWHRDLGRVWDWYFSISNACLKSDVYRRNSAPDVGAEK